MDYSLIFVFILIPVKFVICGTVQQGVLRGRRLMRRLLENGMGRHTILFCLFGRWHIESFHLFKTKFRAFRSRSEKSASSQPLRYSFGALFLPLERLERTNPTPCLLPWVNGGRGATCSQVIAKRPIQQSKFDRTCMKSIVVHL